MRKNLSKSFGLALPARRSKNSLAVSITPTFSATAIGDALAAIRELCPSPLPLTIDTHDAGVRIAAKYGLPFYDALIAAAALEAECTTLYSEDFQDGQVLEGRLTVRNPFRRDTRPGSKSKR